MPIQPFDRIGYDQIPDSEDVTPIDGSIAKRAKKSFRYLALGVVFAVFAGAVAYFIYRFVTSIPPAARVFETSMYFYPDQGGLHPVTVRELESTGAYVKKLRFGNVKCHNSGGIESCSGLKMHTSTLEVDHSKRFQELIGFGGAFTESAALNFFSLPAHVQQAVVDKYFTVDKGIGFTVGRIHINSCDFSVKSYSFDDIPGDFDLRYFDTEVTHDNAFIIPFIRAAMEAAEKSGFVASDRSKKYKAPIKLLASPWSPPAWMKVPDKKGEQKMTGSSQPNGLIDDPKVMMAWARYISLFIKAYKGKGVPVWAVTPQNEPEFAAPWEACAYNSSFQSHFVNNYLGPVVKTEHEGKVLILAYDHNKDHLLEWTKTVIGGDTGNYVDGMAFHWYSGGARTQDGTYGYDAVNASHAFAPDKIMLATEGCSCPGVQIDSWFRAERLAHDVMFDLQNHAQGWIDWNFLLDHSGGPNHEGNLCDAAMILNEDKTDVHIQPSYYYLGHFSKFIPPGSTRIHSKIVGDFAFEQIDPNIPAGNLEAGMFHCERSVRQSWRLNSAEHLGNSTIELNAISTSTESVKSQETKSGADTIGAGDDATTDKVTKTVFSRLCITRGTEDRPFLRVGDCESAEKYGTSIHFTKVEGGTGQLMDTKTGMCMSFVGDVREPGALLNLAPCVPKSHKTGIIPQTFVIDSRTGEVHAPKVQNLCLTAGWPFLNAIAFEQPTAHEDKFEEIEMSKAKKSAAKSSGASGKPESDVGEGQRQGLGVGLGGGRRKTTIVISNQADMHTGLAVLDKTARADGQKLGLVVKARSMQTIVY